MSEYVINNDQPRPIYKLIAVSVSMSWLHGLDKYLKNIGFFQANGSWVDSGSQVLKTACCPVDITPLINVKRSVVHWVQ